MSTNLTFKQSYGSFTPEKGGRLSGHKIFVSAPRRDGKYPVAHVFGSGKRIAKLYTAQQLSALIAEAFEGEA